MEQMLAHLSSASAQAAAASLVSWGHSTQASRCPPAGPPTLAHLALCLLPPAAHQRGGSLPHLLCPPHLGCVPTLWPQILQVSGPWGRARAGKGAAGTHRPAPPPTL